MINFGSMPQRSDNWAWFKTLITSKRCAMQWETDGHTYTIYSYDGPEAIWCSIWLGNVPSGVATTYSQAQNDADKADFETNYKPLGNHSLIPRDSYGTPRTATQKGVNSRVTLFSHDWTDKTTWYSTAVFVSQEIPTDTNGQRLVYQLTHTFVIDAYHGKLSQEAFLKDSNSRNFRSKVCVNSALPNRAEQDPHTGAGGDYTIDYEAGTITFLAALQPGDVLTVDYHYATSSRYILRPDAGKILRLETAEVQFSRDIVMTDSAFFQAMGLVDVFAPMLVGNGPGQIPSGTKIPLSDPFIYKRLVDFQNDASRAYPTVPAIGGNNWRSSPEIVVFNWDYASSTALSSAAGMELHVYLEHDVPFGGTFATASFYCTSENE